ncbi:hypothetical protein [Mycobacterium sp. Root265]|uniref:hypothetical protein n=1 Tax=Mycobacterium sp. Root265 TaxID=1736504 RepID=UPI000A87DEEA|nr:hypothetical protein [Mycobacterium sp. Root265]
MDGPLAILTDQVICPGGGVAILLLDHSLPLIATADRPWQQNLSDGTRHAPFHRAPGTGHRNFYQRAKEQTLGLSDDIAKLAKAKRVPGALKKDFCRQVDSVVAIAPE